MIVIVNVTVGASIVENMGGHQVSHVCGKEAPSMVFDISVCQKEKDCGYWSSIIAALRWHYCLLALVSCRIVLQDEICSKDLSRHDGVSCVFKVETAVGITKFKSRTVQREARLCLRGGGGQKHTCRRYPSRDTHATGWLDLDLDGSKCP